MTSQLNDDPDSLVPISEATQIWRATFLYRKQYWNPNVNYFWFSFTSRRNWKQCKYNTWKAVVSLQCRSPDSLARLHRMPPHKGFGSNGIQLVGRDFWRWEHTQCAPGNYQEAENFDLVNVSISGLSMWQPLWYLDGNRLMDDLLISPHLSLLVVFNGSL